VGGNTLFESEERVGEHRVKSKDRRGLSQVQGLESAEWRAWIERELSEDHGLQES
jgi:hypothetical protein